MGRKAFIVRPFGTKSGIDFDYVHRQLIDPALTACKIEGGTTALLAKQYGAAIVNIDINELLNAP